MEGPRATPGRWDVTFEAFQGRFSSFFIDVPCFSVDCSGVSRVLSRISKARVASWQARAEFSASSSLILAAGRRDPPEIARPPRFAATRGLLGGSERARGSVRGRKLALRAWFGAKSSSDSASTALRRRGCSSHVHFQALCLAPGTCSGRHGLAMPPVSVDRMRREVEFLLSCSAAQGISGQRGEEIHGNRGRRGE